MTYHEAVRYLLSLGRELAAPTQAASAKFDLENISTLADRLGRPDRAYPSVHIAGTNGKGSTAAFLESILRHAGFRTGLNTSPHLEKINERIRINGENISDDDLAQTLSRIVEVVEELLASGKLRAHPTYFECVTAMAFEYFARQHVEFAVVETGLGGRLDATNIITPVACVITRIDFDHENFLGHSLPEIAGEKAGILKERVPVVLAGQRSEARDIILARAKKLDCRVIETESAFRIDQVSIENGCWRARVTQKDSGWFAEIAPPLAGRFQLQNALNAVAVTRLLEDRGFRLTSEHITEGIHDTVWPGRLEKIQSRPDVYLDGAHNPSAARELATFIDDNFAGRKIFLIYAAMRDKAVDEIAGLLFPRAFQVIFTEPRTSRAISAAQLSEMSAHHAPSSMVITDPEQALDYALSKASGDDAVFVTGSLYLVGAVRSYWKGRAQVASR